MKRRHAAAVSARQAGNDRLRTIAAIALSCAALVLTGRFGGLLYDRVATGSGLTEGADLVAAPFILLMIAVAVLVLPPRFDTSKAARLPVTMRAVSAISFVAFLVWCAVLVPGSVNRHSSLTVLAILAAAGCLAYAWAQIGRTPHLALGLAAAIAGAGSVAAGVGLNEYLLHWIGGDAAWRVFAGFTMPNFLAGFLAMTIPVTAALFLGLQDRNWSVLAGFGLALQSLCLLLTQSRLGLLSIACGVVVLLAGVVTAGGLAGRYRRRVAAMLALLVIAAVIGARPIIHRLMASKDQSYSQRFRELTWRGTIDMVRARPITGHGLANFDTAYPPHARVGFTQHAHNSFLQLVAETGVVGGVLFVLSFLPVLALGFTGIRAGPAEVNSPTDRRFLQVSLAAALVSAAVHNAFDSDLYVPANALMFGSVVGLLSAVALQRAALSGTHPVASRVATTSAKLLGWLAAVFVGAIGFAALAGRAQAAGAFAAMRSGDAGATLGALRSAIGWEPSNPEYRLYLANTLGDMGRQADAERELRAAVRVAPTAKVHYKLGRFLLAQGRPDDAMRALTDSRTADPTSLQNLLALANAHKALNDAPAADAVMNDIVAMYRGPIGRIRAVPEVVDWEYAEAFLGLAEHALAAGRRADAAAQLDEGCRILAELWRTHKDPLVSMRTGADAMKRALDRYEWALSARADTLDTLGRGAEARDLRRRLDAVRSDREKELDAQSGGN